MSSSLSGVSCPNSTLHRCPTWDLGPQLDIIDFERGVATAGSRFYFLKGAGARLQRVLSNWFPGCAYQ